MVFAEFEAVCVSFDGSLDAFFIVGFQDVVEGFEIEGLDGELAVACGEDDFDGIVSSLDFLGAFEAVHEGHFDVKEEDVYVRVDVQEVEDFFSVLAFSDDLDAGEWSRVRISVLLWQGFRHRLPGRVCLAWFKGSFFCFRLWDLVKGSWLHFLQLRPVRLLFLLQR